MVHGFLSGDISSGCFNYVFGSTFFPRYVYGFGKAVHRNFLSVYDKALIIDLKALWEPAKSRVISQHISQIFKIRIPYIYARYLYFGHVHAGSDHNSCYPSEPADTNFDRHFFPPMISNDNIFLNDLFRLKSPSFGRRKDIHALSVFCNRPS